MLWIQIFRTISFMSPPEGHQQEILSIRRGGWCVPGHFRHTTLSGGTAMSLADLLELTMLRSFGNHHLRVYLHTLNFPGTLSSLAGLSTCLGPSSSTRCLDTIRIRRLSFVDIGGWKGSISFFTASLPPPSSSRWNITKGRMIHSHYSLFIIIDKLIDL